MEKQFGVVEDRVNVHHLCKIEQPKVPGASCLASSSLLFSSKFVLLAGGTCWSRTKAFLKSIPAAIRPVLYVMLALSESRDQSDLFSQVVYCGAIVSCDRAAHSHFYGSNRSNLHRFLLSN